MLRMRTLPAGFIAPCLPTKTDIANSTHEFLVAIEPVSSWCLISRSQYKLGGEALSIQFGREGGVTHQLSGEPKMRFVSTTLVMMAMALMLLVLMLQTR